MSTSPSISAIDLRDYAVAHGWHLVREAVKDRLFVLSHPQYAPHQLVFAMEDWAPDYEESLLRAVADLAEIEEVPLDQLLAKVEEAPDDTLEFRLASPKLEGAFLPLNFAEQMVENIKKLLQAAACSVANPQLYHPRLSRSESDSLLEAAKMRHTQPGSFRFKVSCGVFALESQPRLPGREEDFPFVRRATLTARRSMSQLVEAIETDTLDELVSREQKQPAPMLSANFCEAVTHFHDPILKNSLDFSLAWSLLVPAPAEDTTSSVIRVRPEYFPRIEEVQRALRPQEKSHDDTFIGTVEKLEGEMGEDQRRSGNVIVRLMLPDGELVSARVQLDAAQYEDAARTHLIYNRYVQVDGKLEPGRQPRTISDLRGFKFLS